MSGLLPRYRVVVVTDRRVHLFTADLWRVCGPKDLLGTWAHGALVFKRSSLVLQSKILPGNQTLFVRNAYDDQLREALAICASRVRPGPASAAG